MLFLLSYLLLCTSLAFFFLCFQIGVLVVELTWFYAYCNGMVFMLYLRHNWCKFWICWCQFGWNHCVVFGDACLFIYLYISSNVSLLLVHPLYFVMVFLFDSFHEREISANFFCEDTRPLTFRRWLPSFLHEQRTRVIAQIASFRLMML